jgi:hypothetical protein
MKRLITIVPFLILTIISIGQNQTKEENLKTVWPEEYKWKIASNQEDKTIHFLEIIPGKERVEKWTMLGTMMSMKNTKIASIDQVVGMYKESSLKQSPKAMLTILEKNDTAKNVWVLFKVETPSFPNDPKPESQLYYAIQGEKTLYVTFIAIKEKTLSNDFLIKWSKVFKNSELVYQ